MLSLEKVKQADFEEILPLFSRFHNSKVKISGWKQLFMPHWHSKEDYFGYKLTNNNEVVGYIGLIFSIRLVENTTCEFCNLTTWVIKEGYENRSLMLLTPLLKMKDKVITSFFPAKHVLPIMQKLGFRIIGKNILLVPNPIVTNFHCRIESDLDKIKPQLSEKELQIINDHQAYKNLQFLFLKQFDDTCLIIYNKKKLRFLKTVQILYVGNDNLYINNSNFINRHLCFKNVTPFVLVDEMFFKHNPIKALFKYKKLPLFKLIKGKEDSIKIIDTLYSETVILDI